MVRAAPPFQAPRPASVADRGSPTACPTVCPTLPAEPTARSRRRRFLPLLVLVAAALVVWLSGAWRLASIDGFIEHRADALRFVETHPVAAYASLAAGYAAAVALSIPGALVLTLIAGFLFGALAGGLLAVLSATAGATVLFTVARSSLGAGLRRRFGPRLQKITCGFREDAFNYLLFLRLVPIAPFWVVNLAPALIGVRTRTFVLSTLIGIMPGTFTFAAVGSGLESVIAAQEAANAGCVGAAACRVSLDLHALVTPKLLIGAGLLGLMSLLPVALRRWRRARTAA